MTTLNTAVVDLLAQPGAQMLSDERVIAVPGQLRQQQHRPRPRTEIGDLHTAAIAAQREMQLRLRQEAKAVSDAFESRIAQSANNYIGLQTWAKVQAMPGQTRVKQSTALDRKIASPLSNAASVASRDLASSQDTIPISALPRLLENPFYRT